ncbi:hypothetical protein O3M35_005699 [Rhynocoris fuscipes]|uniref:BTB domain-containing protein n=1 Tax=Rhynocoris fuscipes TaxID=488301 RepID=A0AAW1DRK5_9HEMI
MPDNDWQIHQGSIAERGKFILKTGLWSDCKFVVSNAQNRKEFKAHKLILSMSSPVFEKMFQNNFDESENDINIVDIQPEAFGAMLNYIYADEIKIQSFDQACELCYIANKYMMPKLLKHCTSYIWKDVNYTNACRGYEFAKLFDQHQLMEKCKKIIQNQTSAIVTHSSFTEIQLSTLKMILEETALNISEAELFKAVESWTRAEFERRDICGNEHLEEQQAIYSELVPHICFLSMRPTEFAEGPAVSSLLTKDQAFAILMNLSSPNCSYPMPPGFSKMSRKKQADDSNKNIFLGWPLENYTPTNNLPMSESSLNFCCNKDIEIVGVMVMGQIHTNSRPSLGEKYRENLNIYIQDLLSKKYECSSYKSTVEYAARLDIYFSSPIKISHGRTYKLGIVLNQSGSYMSGTLHAKELIYKSVNFTFFNSDQPMFINGIIFSF